MTEEVDNNSEINNINEEYNINSPDRQSKKNSRRKRKELINNDSDNDENNNKQININTDIKKNKTDEENKENLENIQKSKYENNRFNTIDKRDEKSQKRDNSALQEKLKKIFMNRDKLKFQYNKQDIPDNLKYHSDDSESSEISGLRKSKISKKNYELFEEKNDNKEIKIEEKNDLNIIESEEKSQKKEYSVKTLNNRQKKEQEKIFNRYNDKIDEKTKSNENNENKSQRRRFNYNDRKNDLEKKDEENVPPKVIKKDDKKEIETPEPKNNDNDDKGEEENNNKNKIDKKQKLLKLLIEKKNINAIEEKYKKKEDESNIEKNEISKDDEDKKDALEMEFETEEKNRRRKIKFESNNSTTNKNLSKKDEFIENYNKGKKEKFEENTNNKNKEEIDENNKNDKGTYLFTSHRNKLTINIKPKENLEKEEYPSKGDKEFENENEEEKELKKNKKENALLNIFEKLKQKKSNESKLKLPSKEKIENDDNNNKQEIDESEIEKEAEKIKKREKKLEQRKLAKELKNIANKGDENDNKINNNDEKEDNNKNNYFYENKRRISNKRIRQNELKNEEIKRRKKLEEDLKEEINKKESFNEVKEDEISTVNNTSKSNLANNSYSNTRLTQNENEEKNTRKEFSYKPIPVRNTANISGRYKNTEEGNPSSNEIVLNDIPSSSLDRSFDAVNAYMKRKIPKGKNSINIYKPKKANNNIIRNRSQERNFNEFIENDSKSFNPSQNAIYKNNNLYNSPNLYRNKNSFGNNNNFVKTNHSFCEYPVEDSNPNLIKERKGNMGIDLGGGLNSSFDAYMKTNINNNVNGNIFNTKKTTFNGNSSNKYNTSGFNKKTYIPINKNYSKNSDITKCFYKNDNVNKSYGYINTGLNNNTSNIFENNNLGNNNGFNNNNNININYNRNIYNGNNNNNYLYNMKSPQFITYNNQNSLMNYNNNIPLKTYSNHQVVNMSNDNYENEIYQNPPSIPRRYTSNKIKNTINNITTPTNINNNNYIYNNININNPPVQQYQTPTEKSASINIEDLLVLEEKYREIIINLKRNKVMHNECFEFWNYYYNCSLYGQLEKLFKNKNDSLNIQISINHILVSVMICYDFSFEIEILNGEISILEDILNLNHRNLFIIYEHILSKISSESKSNIWVLKLNNLINNFNLINNNNIYNTIKGRQLSSVDKISYNTSIIIQNIRVLLKNYKTQRCEYLTSIFKKINEKSYEEIDTFFRDNILRVDNISGSVLASVFLKENEYFQTEPAPYIKTKNRKPYSLILDLDETLVHFKINSEDESEGVLQIRPGVIPFLEQVGKYYELIVFTAATQEYGDLLIDAIEENNLYFEHRFYRQHTVIIGNDFVKDLNRIGRPIDKVIIVDNMPQNFRLQKENGINIKAFWGEDVDDNALEELGIILINIAKEGGDLRKGLEKYKDEIVRKVTSNISKSNY